LKAKKPDVLLPSSYTADAYLFLNTAKELDYNPKLLVAQNAGYTDPKFIATMGSKAEGVITRSPFNTDLATTIPMIGTVNDLFKTHSGGRDLRSEEHTSELQSQSTISYAVFCLKKKTLNSIQQYSTKL